MRMLRIAGAVLFASLAACATPPEIKQALAAKDQAYTENEQLMQQYRELVSNVTTRHLKWYRFVQTRLKLDLALQWATTNPHMADVPDAALAEDDATLLGPDVLGLINSIRLKSLPERKGANGQPLFAAGSGDMSTLVQQLPDLIARVEQRVAAGASIPQGVDLTAFDRYRSNVDALRRINGLIKQYLDIDVTVSRTDVQSLADALRTVRR
ncbi:MAG: hypothetical protein ABS70_03885 [Nitrospira sp. SCN 59-13]|nr:MAG: hypothetical protein ABS70_03885 [Nitrospira sp. SCN 59-13]